MQAKACLDDLQHGSRGEIATGLLEHSLMVVRVEGLMQSFDGLAMVLLEHTGEVLSDHAEAFEQATGVGVLFGGFDGTGDVVDDGEEVGEQRKVGVAAFFLDFAPGAFADVVGLGLGAQELILSGGQFLREAGDFLWGGCHASSGLGWSSGRRFG